jgi:hypothetical protein
VEGNARWAVGHRRRQRAEDLRSAGQVTGLERERAIVDVLAMHSGRFAWGERDCVTLVADVVAALRGARPVDVTWASADDADDELERRGGLRAAVSGVLGDPLDLSVDAPQAGDACLIRIRQYEFMAVWANGRAIAPAEHGLRRIDPRHIVAVWRV